AFFYSSRRRHTRSKRDWSSDVCSSDLIIGTNSTAYTGSDLLVFTLSCIAVSWIAFVILVSFGRILGSIDNNGKIIFYINKVSARSEERRVGKECRYRWVSCV